VTGKTGSGKSTTLAAMIDDINSRVKGHILTIGIRSNSVHHRKSCLISQREIGVHSPSFACALIPPAAEIRMSSWSRVGDLETMSIAVPPQRWASSSWGHCIEWAAPTVDRMINVFPSDKQSHVRTMLSTSLRGVVSQQHSASASTAGPRCSPGNPGELRRLAEPDPPGKLDQLENVMQGRRRVRNAHHGYRRSNSC